ncbi:MAG TPA: ABC transporter permease, partial [Longimicrobiales bacterium]|nr:ABC transporter permease [Longimicrobiales bacterium]
LDLIGSALAERISPTWVDPSMTRQRTRAGWPMSGWIQDLKLAGRGLKRTPGFTAIAIGTLGLAIGANAGIFSVVDTVLLRPLPYPEPGELVLLYQSSPRTEERLGRVSLEDLTDWGERTRTLEAVAGYAPVPTILMGRGDAVEVEFTYVTAAFFELLGAGAAQGRTFDESDFRERARHAVVSDAFWRTHLGGSRDVIGSTVLLRGDAYTVIGVMPASMRHPTPETAVWVPQSLVEPNMFSNGEPTRGDRYLGALGRLAAGADAAQAEAELTSLSRELAETHPSSNRDWTAAAVVPLHESIVGDVDEALLVVLGVVGFILLIACVNLANLLLVRGSARSREMAVRAALGAGRRRLLRQLLTESVTLALIGGVVGLLLSYWGVQTIVALSADTLPRLEAIRLDGRVVAFGLALSAITGLLFGLVPALRMARMDPQQDLRGGRGTVGAEGQRLRGALVIAEVALAVLLVIGAGLMARSFLSLRNVDPGFQAEGVLTVALQLNLAGVPDQEMASFLVQRREQILERVRELPGVEHAGMINVFPLRTEGAFTQEYVRADAPADATGVQADTRYIDPGYPATMGIPLLRGEPLPASLAEGAPVPALLSESAARRLWPDGNPVGGLLRQSWGDVVVIGVVGDVRQLGLAEEAAPAIYFPQSIAPRLLATLVVRTSGDPMRLAQPIRELVRDVDPNQPIRSLTPLASVMHESIAQERFFAVLFAVFGGLALTLAAVGIYGVLAYTVRQRTQEIGVRMALGARPFDVLRTVAGAGLQLVAAGVVIGTGAALVLTRLLESQLYGVQATDPFAFAASIAFLFLVAVLAIYIPALRATRIPPMTALRPE